MEVHTLSFLTVLNCTKQLDISLGQPRNFSVFQMAASVLSLYPAVEFYTEIIHEFLSLSLSLSFSLSFSVLISRCPFNGLQSCHCVQVFITVRAILEVFLFT